MSNLKAGMDRKEHYEMRISGSSLSEKMIATWMLLNNKENCVKVFNKTITPDFESRMDHVDSGDLLVNGRKIEIKHSSRSFQYGHWPFDKFFICNKNSFDRAYPEPSFYFVINKEMTVAAVVNVSATRDRWTVEKVSDRDRPGGDNYLAYCLPLDDIIWQNIGNDTLFPKYQITFSENMEIVSCGTV